eukprot:422524-Prorocentrum_minimum.AAC.1
MSHIRGFHSPRYSSIVVLRQLTQHGLLTQSPVHVPPAPLRPDGRPPSQFLPALRHPSQLGLGPIAARQLGLGPIAARQLGLGPIAARQLVGVRRAPGRGAVVLGGGGRGGRAAERSASHTGALLAWHLPPLLRGRAPRGAANPGGGKRIFPRRKPIARPVVGEGRAYSYSGVLLGTPAAQRGVTG